MSQARESFREPRFTKELTASKRVSFPGLALLFAQARNALTASIMLFRTGLGMGLHDDRKDGKAAIAVTPLGALMLFSTEEAMAGDKKLVE